MKMHLFDKKEEHTMSQQNSKQSSTIMEVEKKEAALQALFETFDQGFLKLPSQNISFSEISWSKHPAFEGVELKHIVTAKDTQRQFSYHLVRIAPGKSIGNHTHETQLETHEVIAGSGICIHESAVIPYEPGTISILPAGIPHEVNAKETGLYLFAKFMPALC